MGKQEEHETVPTINLPVGGVAEQMHWNNGL